MKREQEPAVAPELNVQKWFNTDRELSLAALRGRVVLVHAFQMLCPGCVARGIPQAQKAAEIFAGTDLVVLGLHTVFEHHDAMGPRALEAFIHEYKIRFPVGVDTPGPDGERIPRTMAAYAMRGTPTTILIDRRGRLREQIFGVHDDMILGSEITSLLLEGATTKSDAKESSAAAEKPSPSECDDIACPA